MPPPLSQNPNFFTGTASSCILLGDQGTEDYNQKETLTQGQQGTQRGRVVFSILRHHYARLAWISPQSLFQHGDYENPMVAGDCPPVPFSICIPSGQSLSSVSPSFFKPPRTLGVGGKQTAVLTQMFVNSPAEISLCLK